MRLRFILLFGLAMMAGAQANPPEINSVSPDKAWVISARWVKTGESFEGYDWELRNVKTGKVYFHEEIQKDEALPHNFGVMWTADSRYAAINFYYGRALQEVNVVVVGQGEPELINPIKDDGKTPLERTLIKSEDLAAFTGYNRLVKSTDGWNNNTDLNIEIDLLGYLEDKKTGTKMTLSAMWHRTVHLDGKTVKVLETVCDSYEKIPEGK